jgi:hypothetical protein
MDLAIPPPPPRLLAMNWLPIIRDLVIAREGSNELQVLDIAALFDEQHLRSQPILANKSHLKWPLVPLPRN